MLDKIGMLKHFVLTLLIWKLTFVFEFLNGLHFYMRDFPHLNWHVHLAYASTLLVFVEASIAYNGWTPATYLSVTFIFDAWITRWTLRKPFHTFNKLIISRIVYLVWFYLYLISYFLWFYIDIFKYITI